MPAPAGIRRLTGPQYVNSVRVLLGDAAGDLAVSLMHAADPPFDATLDGFDTVGAASFTLSPPAVEQLERFAAEIAAFAAADPTTLAKIVPCAPTGPADAVCHRAFVTSFGRLAWRRPLEDDEATLLTDLAQKAATHPALASFEAGVSYALSAILQSPYFVYIVEIGDDGADDPARRRLTDL